jgi:signal transduction histidine kinase
MTTPRTPARENVLWREGWRIAVAFVVGVLAFLVTRGFELVSFDEAGVSVGAAYAGMMVLDALLGLLAIGLLPLRRRAPLATAIVLAVVSAFSVLACAALVIAVVSLATRRRPGELVIAGVVLVVAATVADVTLLSGLTAAVFDPEPVWLLLLATAGFYGLMVVTGLYIGGRRELLAALTERAELVEADQALRLENARAGERELIAREMHDALAHRLSLVALHSGALAYRDDLSPAQTTATAEIVRDNARLALGELREVLGAVRDPDPESSRAPQPTLASLDTLLDENRAAGLAVEVDIEPGIAAALDSLSTTQSRHAFRMVQESLTNARRHGHGAEVSLAIDGRPGERLEITVANPVAPGAGLAPGGLGLLGLEERARLAGGELHHTVEGGRFIVTATLPWSR